MDPSARKDPKYVQVVHWMALARKRVVTPSSQAKKSILEVRRGIFVILGKAFETIEERE